MGVPESWAALQGNWASHAPDFFTKLFAKYPETQSDFPALAGLDSGSLKSSPNTVAQFENVRKGLESMVSNLGNASGLDAAAAKLAATHKDRSMPAANFQKAFEVFVDYCSGTAGFDAGAWKSALDDFYKRIAAKM